ncbi:hypothetical protein FA95DRAFT_591086 [Auriscalpium vulgare]|uniref:Uncharacterized protein n=1 Tax=Auriscalpium vulgare TaxID=40419 RepID=A0ACB8REE4_9AGAM|nr:hypothetical protein FA95DRAFT_591086 [Auriscalpium vulgare]
MMTVENNLARGGQKFLTPVRHETVLVQLEAPTALDVDRPETFELVDGNNLIMQFAISSLYVVDGTVNPARFCAALSRTLQRFPTAAGRLGRKGDDWHIDLCNAPVPVHVASSPSHHVLPHLHSADRLARSDDAPSAAYVVQPTPHVELYVDKVDLAAAMTGASDAYLCSFVLTHMGDGRTVVGLSWHHVLGDQVIGLWAMTCVC